MSSKATLRVEQTMEKLNVTTIEEPQDFSDKAKSALQTELEKEFKVRPPRGVTALNAHFWPRTLICPSSERSFSRGCLTRSPRLPRCPSCAF